jgi:hypothetical protein
MEHTMSGWRRRNEDKLSLLHKPELYPERGLPLLMTLLALAYKDVGALVPATSEQRRFERPKTALSAESSNIQRKPLFCAFDEVPLELATIIIGHLIEYDLAPTFHSEYTE